MFNRDEASNPGDHHSLALPHWFPSNRLDLDAMPVIEGLGRLLMPAADASFEKTPEETRDQWRVRSTVVIRFEPIG